MKRIVIVGAGFSGSVVARELAAAGFPTVRIRPDADPVHREIDLERPQCQRCGWPMLTDLGVEA